MNFRKILEKFWGNEKRPSWMCESGGSGESSWQRNIVAQQLWSNSLLYINIYFHFHLPLVIQCNLLWHINCDPTINRISIIHCFLRTIQGSIWDKNANKLLKNTPHKLHTKHCRYCRFRKGANNKRKPKTIFLQNMNAPRWPSPILIERLIDCLLLATDHRRDIGHSPFKNM